MSAGAIHSGERQRGDVEVDCDTVVIGSGAGGAVLATHLAEAGERVIVIEEGPHLPSLEMGSMRQSESIRHVWRDGAMTLAIGTGGGPSINVTTGRAVGGSSTLTGGVCFRIPDHVLNEWSRELALQELSPKGMEPYFEAVEKDVHVEEVPESMRSRGTRLFGEGAAKFGAPMKSMRRNTRGCNGCGRCNFGCPHGAKMSVDLSYLPRAIAAGADIWSDCSVERIRMDGARATGVDARIRDIDGKKRRLRVRGKRVVVAAGAMHTPLLLSKSGVARDLPALGKNLTLHPSFRVMARFDQPVRGWEGALQSAYIDHFEESEGMLFNSLYIPNGVMAATMPGFGPRYWERAKHVANLAIFGGMLHDDAGGSVHPGPFGGDPILTYRMSERDFRRIPPLLRRMSEFWFAAGARDVILPVFGSPPLDADGVKKFPLEDVPGQKFECSSQHPLGSCQMGVARGLSVVDPNGKVWGTDNLYLACGSIMPTSLGVNPQLAIMSMATRIAFKLRERRPH
ncbi:MAG: GMC family oxidoreductase [Polyangiales bacterium]